MVRIRFWAATSHQLQVLSMLCRGRNVFIIADLLIYSLDRHLIDSCTDNLWASGGLLPVRTCDGLLIVMLVAQATKCQKAWARRALSTPSLSRGLRPPTISIPAERARSGTSTSRESGEFEDSYAKVINSSRVRGQLRFNNMAASMMLCVVLSTHCWL